MSLVCCVSGFGGPSSFIHISLSKVSGLKLFHCLVANSARAKKPLSTFAVLAAIRSESLNNSTWVLYHSFIKLG